MKNILIKFIYNKFTFFPQASQGRIEEKGVWNWEKRHNEEFANWFAEHVRKLKNAPKPLKDISKWPGCVVYRMAACSVNGALFRTVEADKKRLEILVSC